MFSRLFNRLKKFVGKCGDSSGAFSDRALENYYRIVLRKNVDKGIKKEELFIEIKNFINKFNKYNTSNNINKCIKIQSLMRGKIGRDKLMTNRCNNEEDFYTYDNLKDIDTFYFYGQCT